MEFPDWRSLIHKRTYNTPKPRSGSHIILEEDCKDKNMSVISFELASKI